MSEEDEIALHESNRATAEHKIREATKKIVYFQRLRRKSMDALDAIDQRQRVRERERDREEAKQP